MRDWSRALIAFARRMTTVGAADIVGICRDCDTFFRLDVSEHRFHLRGGFDLPTRCRACRAARRTRGAS